MYLSKHHIAGVVILYNSPTSCEQNIETYIDQVSKLYIIDNSDIVNTELVDNLRANQKIQYYNNHGNQGVAHALNQAARLAIGDGFSYLLTMDDDSQAPTHLIETMITFLNHYFYLEKVGIISVAHSNVTTKNTWYRVPYTMTSGNLLNLTAYQEVGPFLTELFIDHVDHEYGLRLGLNKYSIVELRDLRLVHRLGELKNRRFMSKKIQFISHSPERLYYFIRNGVYICKTYFWNNPVTCLLIVGLTIKESLKSIVLEDQKIKRFQFIIRALGDGYTSKLDKLD